MTFISGYKTVYEAKPYNSINRSNTKYTKVEVAHLIHYFTIVSRQSSLISPIRTSSTYPRAGPPANATENRIPRCTTAISPGATSKRPNSVVILNEPVQ